MKLRHDKDKPIIVLEAGDVSAIVRVRGLLLSAAKHLDDKEAIEILGHTANRLHCVASGLVEGVTLPSKRIKPEQPPTLLDACGSMPGDVEAGESGADGSMHCPKCQAMLTRAEVRRGGACFACEPVVEASHA